MSDTLTGEVWLAHLSKSGTGFDQIYYFRGASKEFLVELATLSEYQCYAPKVSGWPKSERSRTYLGSRTQVHIVAHNHPILTLNLTRTPILGNAR